MAPRTLAPDIFSRLQHEMRRLRIARLRDESGAFASDFSASDANYFVATRFWRVVFRLSSHAKTRETPFKMRVLSNRDVQIRANAVIAQINFPETKMLFLSVPAKHHVALNKTSSNS
jgi:hypothetical protein